MPSVILQKRASSNKEEEPLYYAADTQEFPIRYLNLSGTDLTTKRSAAWVGTELQFINICRVNEWDGLQKLPKTKIK